MQQLRTPVPVPGYIIVLGATFFLLEYLLLYLKENQFEAVTINNLINEN